MESKRRHPSDDDVDHSDRPADLREKKMKMPYPSENVNDSGRPAARSTTGSAETDRARLNSCEVNGQHASDDYDVNNNAPPAGSGLALLNAYEWLDVASCLDHYENATLRFASGALNRLLHSKASILPLRLIAALLVGYKNAEQRCWARAFKADFRNVWPDLVFESRASPESMLVEVLKRCDGFTVGIFELRNLPYTEQVMNATASCWGVSASEVFVNGIASGHDNVHRMLELVPGLRRVTFKNGAAHPNAAAVLSVCAARRIPNVTMDFAVYVTEAQILDFLSATTTSEFGICSFRQPISDNFFERIVESCRRHVRRSLRFVMGGILTDPTNANYKSFVVDRDDSAALYKFEQAGHTCVPFTILVDKSKRFCLSVFQGTAHDMCSSLDVTRKITTCRI